MLHTVFTEGFFHKLLKAVFKFIMEFVSVFVISSSVIITLVLLTNHDYNKVKILFVYHVCPVVLLETDKPLTRDAGKSFGPIIVVENNVPKGVLAHELVHSEQYYRLPIFHVFLLLNTKYMAFCEAEAFYKANHATTVKKLVSLLKSYDFGLSEEELQDVAMAVVK